MSSNYKVSTVGLDKDDVLDKFRQELKQSGIYNEARHDDWLLMRFLRARKYKIPESKLMLENSEKWRKSFEVDKILKTFAFPESAEVRKIYNRFYHKTDKIGRPVYIEQLANLDLKKMFAITDTDRLVKHYVREYEKLVDYRLPACTAKYGSHIGQSFTILDLKGVPLSSFPQVKKVVNELSSVSQDNYPETLGMLFIVNAPTLFAAIWSVVKGWLDENTVSKIHLLGSNYQKQILEHVEAANLPKEYGGNCQCEGGCSNSDHGPWNDGTVPGYPKTEWEFGVLRDNEQSLSCKTLPLAQASAVGEEVKTVA